LLLAQFLLNFYRSEKALDFRPAGMKKGWNPRVCLEVVEKLKIHLRRRKLFRQQVYFDG
jgi:hypothetical protein